LGIPQERLVEHTFGAHDKVALVQTVWKFTGEMEALGPLKAKKGRKAEGLKR
jgi:hypothetical protein